MLFALGVDQPREPHWPYDSGEPRPMLKVAAPLVLFRIKRVVDAPVAPTSSRWLQSCLPLLEDEAVVGEASIASVGAVPCVGPGSGVGEGTGVGGTGVLVGMAAC